ncbi:3-deoxy-D-manno-octulosonate cytidylyltransferase (modular protein) [Nitrospina gracilis 3/211]|uniref:3-deoxy-manno-octulosonate cytidylyltransferase n=1 Tax=Nitrospina gracilis (strain 3/211) TaxID=1266370 RepID=M1ZD77_NITG3|nr:3-deoxy-manno-octulosonate cytidylyltransferase [Nitrospina gracilis]CCQ91379.1 3-deoxy-D-manno-octulosonate cytidylyltransferase (modular protein) [Nitrospina gracilis 3/211]
MSAKPRVVAVIPARWASTRFPGKPLAPLSGRPMIQWVVERARLAPSINDVIVATDDERIVKAVEEFGGNAVMTSVDHPSGSDRIAEVVSKRSCDVVVNVQGDEPLIPPEDIEQVVQILIQDKQAAVATLMSAIDNYEDVFDPNVVKVVTGGDGRALYFSRSPVPYLRDSWQNPSPDRVKDQPVPERTWFRHIGLYAYRRDFLLQYTRMAPTPLEQREKLEQLRILENGYCIKVGRLTGFLWVWIARRIWLKWKTGSKFRNRKDWNRNRGDALEEKIERQKNEIHICDRGRVVFPGQGHRRRKHRQSAGVLRLYHYPAET